MSFFDNLKMKAIRDNVIVPAMGRVGTFVAATLVPLLGANSDDAHKVGVGVAILGCLLFDWAVDRAVRWHAERKGAEKLLEGRLK